MAERTSEVEAAAFRVKRTLKEGLVEWHFDVGDQAEVVLPMIYGTLRVCCV